MDVSEKKLRRKLLAEDVLTEDEGPHTDQIIRISAISLTLLIFVVGWALCSRPQPEHKSVMPLLSLYPLNVLTHKKSILCQQTLSESGLLYTVYLLICI